jgi:hypothetical protein
MVGTLLTPAWPSGYAKSGASSTEGAGMVTMRLSAQRMALGTVARATAASARI